MKLYNESEITSFDIQISTSLPRVIDRIETEDQLCVARRKVTDLKGLKKDIDNKRKSIVDPMNKAKQEVQDLFKPMLAKVDEAIMSISVVITEYAQEQARKQKAIEDQKAKELAELEAKQKEADPADIAESIALDIRKEAIESTVTETVKIKGITTLYSAEVVDINEIPREYMIPDMVKLNNLAKVMKDDFNRIKGVKLVTRQILKG